MSLVSLKYKISQNMNQNCKKFYETYIIYYEKESLAVHVGYYKLTFDLEYYDLFIRTKNYYKEYMSR